MKKIYTLLILLFTLQSASATHIIGGSISYEYLGGDQYKIRLEVLRDCFNGLPPFDEFASIGIFDDNANLIDSLSVPFSGIDDTLSLAVPNNICVFPPDVCVHRTIYSTIVTLPVITGGYTLAYQRCCRSQTISNLINPLDEGMTFHTHIDPAQQNTSPQFNADFPFAVFSNTPFVYDASATDSDGDSLVYELTFPFKGANSTFPMPSVPGPPPYDSMTFVNPPFSVSNMLGGNHPLTIDPQTGEMNAIPPTLGVFQIAYLVKEFRNGIHIGTTFREFTFIVIPPANNQNYDISGSVLINNNIPLDQGKVQILERDIATDSLFLYEEQPVGLNGEYSFFNIPPGVFYVKAIVDSASAYYDTYLPTYYQSSFFWYDADPINQCDTSQIYRDIHLLHVDSLTGNLVMDGTVQLFGDNSPFPGLNLLLGNENGDIIQARTTDANGEFQFENLSAGTYQLYADLINSTIDNTNPPLIEMDENLVVDVFVHDDFLTVEETTNLEPSPFLQKNKFKIFPNPTNANFSLSMDLKTADIYSVKLFSIYGQHIETIFENTYLPQGNFIHEISLENFSNSTFLIEIQNSDRKLIKKVIKY